MEWEFCFYRWKQNAASQKDRNGIATPGPLLSHTWVMVPRTSPGLVDSANASIAILGCKEFMGQMGTKSDVIQMWHWHALTIWFVTVVYVSCFFPVWLAYESMTKLHPFQGFLDVTWVDLWCFFGLTYGGQTNSQGSQSPSTKTQELFLYVGGDAVAWIHVMIRNHE